MRKNLLLSFIDAALGTSQIVNSVEARLDNPPTAAQKERKNAQTRRWRAQKMQENPNYYNDEYYRRHESVLINARRYYYKNQQSCINKMQHWRNNNPEKMKASADNWRRQNPEKLRDGHRCWLQKNKEHVRFYNACRRALKRNATIQVFTDEQLNARMSMFGYKCAYCGGPFEHIDHVIPLSKNGRHCLSNLRPACSKCNLSKHSKNLNKWLLLKKVG